MLFVSQPSPFVADAILPSLMLVWPITIFLLVPIIAVEAFYSRSRLGLSGGQAFRVFGTANIISTLTGLPIAMAIAAAIQNRIQVRLFGTPQANFDALSRGDVSHLGLAMGQYPRWILLVAAVLMFAMGFAISWWIEAAYVQWWVRRRNLQQAAMTHTTSDIVRNANLLSYAMLAIISLCVLAGV
jgi:hypothetical protein